MHKLHWTSHSGRVGKYIGTIHVKLVDDHQKLFAQVTAVANGHRAHVQVHDGKMHDSYWVKDMKTGVENCNQFFLN